MSGPDIETLCEARFLRLCRNGKWEYVERTNSSGAAFVVAVTAERELVLVEQYRPSVQSRTLELPAGMIGDEPQFQDEGIEASALRELEEETGFRAARAERLLTGPVAPGLAAEMLHLVRAHDLTRVHAGGGLPEEDITVHLAPLDGIDDWLAARRAQGLMVEPRIYAALYLVSRQC